MFMANVYDENRRRDSGCAAETASRKKSSRTMHPTIPTTNTKRRNRLRALYRQIPVHLFPGMGRDGTGWDGIGWGGMGWVGWDEMGWAVTGWDVMG